MQTVQTFAQAVQLQERSKPHTVLLMLSQIMVLLTIVTLAWQQNWPIDSIPGYDIDGAPFNHLLPTRRLVEHFALGAVLMYALAGWPHRDRLLRRGAWRWFTLSLLALWVWAALSPLWAAHRGMAIDRAVHMALWIAFGLVIMCSEWPAERMATAFLGGLLIHAAVGVPQFLLQHFIGLGVRFGELPVRPQDNWVSVVFAGSARLLRVYGLSGHPNILGGHLAAGLILSSGVLWVWPRLWRALIVVAWALVWALLLLAFSRSAWLGAVLGAAGGVALLLRGRHIDRRHARLLLTLTCVAIGLTLAFVLLFYPFLINRVDVSDQPFESFSISQRGVMIEATAQLYRLHPLPGVGLANFIVASRQVTPGGFALDWVHNVPLLILVELGVVGLGLSLAMIGSMLVVGWRRWRARSITPWQAVLGGTLICLLAIMMFDHYIWTAPQGGLLWMLLAGWWMRREGEHALPELQS
jgi:O-antigen ligase